MVQVGMTIHDTCVRPHGMYKLKRIYDDALYKVYEKELSYNIDQEHTEVCNDDNVTYEDATEGKPGIIIISW